MDVGTGELTVLDKFSNVAVEGLANRRDFDEANAADSGLDPVRTTLLCDLIREISTKYNATSVVVSHDVGAVRRFADNIGISEWVPIPVSGLAGDNVLTASKAMTWEGLSGSSRRLVTSPTRMPLNSTLPPTCNPETELSKMMR